jgi:phosphate/sulfate permease
VDENRIEFERGVGIFLKASLGLPLSFPHTVACALLGVKHVKQFAMEQ